MAASFKPYTHSQSGLDARADAVDDGQVTINGRNYAIDPRIVDALRRWPTYYNGGVIGPDGFPDLTMGQTVVHPTNSGKWLDFVLQRAWAAQADPNYSPDEKGQTLAFAYGFLTHAAGDVWSHTLINELSGEVFPEVTTALTDPQALRTAARHIILEGYIGDATRGYDGNPDRTVLPDGQVSDDSTPGIGIDAPKRFVYQTLIDAPPPRTVPPYIMKADDPSLQPPTGGRGPLIDGFRFLRQGLVSFVNNRPTSPTQSALNALGAIRDSYRDLRDACDLGIFAIAGKGSQLIAAAKSTGPIDPAFELDDADIASLEEIEAQLALPDDPANPVDEKLHLPRLPSFLDPSGLDKCARAFRRLGFNALQDVVQFFRGEFNRLSHGLLDSYVNAWIDDIDDGLRNWSDFGLASSRAFFDPQARRDAQRALCAKDGDGIARVTCEDNISASDVLAYETEDFVNQHLLSMLGAPDILGQVREAIGPLVDQFLTLPVIVTVLQPIRDLTVTVNEAVKHLIEREIRNRFGVDIELLDALWKSPSSKLDMTSFSWKNGTIPLFNPDEHVHEKLDAYLGLPADHHLPGINTGLRDDIEFDRNTFAAYRNTVTMSKMLLLDGREMDHLLSDLVGHPYRYYQDHGATGNVMTTTLDGGTNAYGGPADPSQWLQLLDGDHAWRSDGAPTFTTPARHVGGAGNFPLWESCSLRDKAFRVLFVDWENNQERFPDLGDPCTPDPSSRATCSYADAGNGAPISGVAGGTIVDSRRLAYSIGDGCALTFIPDACFYIDAGDGRIIGGARGGSLTDSRGLRYSIVSGCTITLIPDICSFKDAGNGTRIEAPKGGVITDSLNNSFWVGWDCKIHR